MVFALATASAFKSYVLGPASKPHQLSGIPVDKSHTFVFALLSKESPHKKSTGRWILTPFYLAFSIT